ncbi:pyruvoyl-dependent arginine decarboxylase [Vulcanisaeta sp. JCM 16159]|uniref:pyruvoyl-dependent arginine decarboxylase n=1 Tax=Vulcanisaeta sp. JCM 16159 TaxID=1295371 RepID=UPI001FB3545D|nr:pyruvoyl-dependent arginine decarboxylase [Vulcanisaeta sp. JCM 16159]
MAFLSLYSILFMYIAMAAIPRNCNPIRVPSLLPPTTRILSLETPTPLTPQNHADGSRV